MLRWPMSLVIAAKTRDGILIACDSRALSSDGEILTRQKILPLSRLCVLGVAGVEQTIQITYDVMRAPRNQEPTFLRPSEWKDPLMCQLRSVYQKVNFMVEPSKRKQADAIIAGQNTNGPVIYLLSCARGFAPAEVDSCAIGIPKIADSLFHDRFDKSLPMQDVQRLALQALSDTAAAYSQVGPPFRLFTMTADGHTEVPQTDVAAKLQQEKRNRRTR